MEIEKFETIKIWIRKVCGSKITEKNYLRRPKNKAVRKAWVS
jgi:hypothetical protein